MTEPAFPPPAVSPTPAAWRAGREGRRQGRRRQAGKKEGGRRSVGRAVPPGPRRGQARPAPPRSLSGGFSPAGGPGSPPVLPRSTRGRGWGGWGWLWGDKSRARRSAGERVCKGVGLGAGGAVMAAVGK